MNQDACTRHKQADQALNETCQGIPQDYARDAQFLAKLRQAQRHGSPSATLHLEARFAAIDRQAQYGISYPACRCRVLSKLTGRGTDELKAWAQRHPRR